jgi:hypothetical protein
VIKPTDSFKAHECRSRDIKRRLEVIQKKMTDLQELGVPCGFCYISARNSGTLFTVGNSAITQVIEQSRDAILHQLSTSQNTPHVSQLPETDTTKEVHMLLPPLPAPLNDLTLQDLRGLVVSIVKDLGLKWTDPKPSFWPENIPFQYPRSAPESFQGCWTRALRHIIKTIYAYFNCNPQMHNWNKMTSNKSASTKTTPSTYHVENYNNEEEEDEEIDVEGAQEQDELYFEEKEDSDSDTISVCSETEQKQINQSAVSYFGYEIAQSESSNNSSPKPCSDHEDTTDNNGLQEGASVHSIIQPKLIYCDPRFYSQLYPASAPLLLPTMFVKQFCAINSSQEDTTISPPARLHNATSEEISSSTPNSIHQQPVVFSFPKATPVGVPPQIDREPRKEKRQTKTNSALDGRNRKGANGMYIYTNPSAPLQFMSLNSRKRLSSIDHENRSDKHTSKLIAGAPVSPHTGEPVVIKGINYKPNVYQRIREQPMKSPVVKNMERNMSSSPPSGHTSSTSHESRNNKHNPQLASKKRRELVFHWYKSPEPPPTKHPKLMNNA